jgi:acyl-CoA dehydrogenase
MSGTPEQKDRYLHPLLAGDLKSAFSMTEPDTAGSDPTMLKTRAVRDGDDWVINGHKWYSSNGSIADFMIVMAVTDPDARPHQRASMFVVDAETPGVNVVRDVATMEHPYDSFGRYGNHAEILCEDVRIPSGAHSVTRPTCRWRRCTASPARRGSTTGPTRFTGHRSLARDLPSE